MKKYQNLTVMEKIFIAFNPYSFDPANPSCVSLLPEFLRRGKPERKKLLFGVLVFFMAGFYAQAASNVILKHQHFDPATLTFDLVVENQGQEDIFLKEIGAEYQIYYHTLWLGIGDLPTLKSSANYQIPIFIAPKCYENAYLEKEVLLFEYMYGIWDCANYVKTDPKLLLPANQSVRFSVQVDPKAMKSYWELEITLSLDLVFDNETRVTTESHLLFTDDIIAVLLPDQILNKQKILEMVNDPEHPGEFINIRNRGLGKLEYTFDRNVAVHHLDKIGLTRDSMIWHLKNLLKESDSRVYLAVFKMARKHRLETLLPDLEAAWWRCIHSEDGDRPYIEWPGFLYTLNFFNQYQYIDSAFLEIQRGRLSGEYVFQHLASHRDSIYGERLLSYLYQHRNDQTGSDDWEIRWGMRKLTSHLFLDLNERNKLLISKLLNSSKNEYIIEGIIEEFVRLQEGGQGNSDLISQFEQNYRDLYHTMPGLRPYLLKLLFYTSGQLEELNDLTAEALTSDEQSLRNAAFDLLSKKEEKEKLARISNTPLGRFIFHLGNVRENGTDSVRFYLRNLVADHSLSTASPNEILALCYLFSDHQGDLSLALPDSAEAFKGRLFDYLGSEEYLNHTAPVHDLIVFVEIFERYSQDSVFVDRVKKRLTQRLERVDWNDFSTSELNSLAPSLVRFADYYGEDPESKIQYYQLATQCFDALLKADSTANRKESATDAYNNLAWYQLLNNQPKSAALTCERGLAIQERHILYTNLALGYLLSKRKKKALDLYNELKDTPYLETGRYYDKPFRLVFLADLQQMEEEGLIEDSLRGDVEEIKKMLVD